MGEYNGQNRGMSGRRDYYSERTILEKLEVFKWPAAIILAAMGFGPLAFALLVLFHQYKKHRRNVRRREQQAWEARTREGHRAGGTHRTAAQEVLERRRSGYTANKESEPATEPTSKKTKEPVSGEVKQIRLLRILGICALVIGAILMLDGVSYLVGGTAAVWDQIFLGGGFLASGGIMWGSGAHHSKLQRRAQRYIIAIGTAETMRLEELAKRVNRTPDETAKELQKLIDKGYLGDDAYIDYEKGCFARFGALTEDEEEECVPKEATEGYSGILRELREANDRIADAKLSGKIERLEQISALIFKEVEAHPEKRDRIRTFFDYYLPTTQKLLDTYAEFDAMGVESDNLRETKERIEAMMDTIVEGFEHQLDQLYHVDAMDVVSDIKVMETMLNRDLASVEKDFGMVQESKTESGGETALQQLEQ